MGTPRVESCTPAHRSLWDAVRFWETGRIAYNLILFAAALGAGEPRLASRTGFWLDSTLSVLLLGNIAYTGAYLMEFALRFVPLGAPWSHLIRVVVWTAGTAYSASWMTSYITVRLYRAGPFDGMTVPLF